MKMLLSAELIQQAKKLAQADSQCNHEEAIEKCDEAIDEFLRQQHPPEDYRQAVQDDLRALLRNGVMVHKYYWERDEPGDKREIKDTCDAFMHAVSSIGPRLMQGQEAILDDMSKKCQDVLASLASGCANAARTSMKHVEEAPSALLKSVQAMASDEMGKMGSDEWMAKMSDEVAPKLSKQADKWKLATSAVGIAMHQENFGQRLEKLQMLPDVKGAEPELAAAKMAIVESSEKAILQSQALVLFYSLKTTCSEAQKAKGREATQLRTNLKELLNLCEENSTFNELSASGQVMDECREMASTGRCSLAKKAHALCVLCCRLSCYHC